MPQGRLPGWVVRSGPGPRSLCCPPSLATADAPPVHCNPSLPLPRLLLLPRPGLPPGVLNIVHGTHDVVNRILDHPDIQAVSFVGSNAAGRHVYSRGAASGKRVQVLRGHGAWGLCGLDWGRSASGACAWAWGGAARLGQERGLG